MLSINYIQMKRERKSNLQCELSSRVLRDHLVESLQVIAHTFRICTGIMNKYNAMFYKIQQKTTIPQFYSYFCYTEKLQIY